MRTSNETSGWSGEGFLDPDAEISKFKGAFLPHWRQEGALYFVTFRLADSVPQQLLDEWAFEQKTWLDLHPQPWSAQQARVYYGRFPYRMHRWLDQGSGSCGLAILQCREIVESALRHFDGRRYALGESVVAQNHVHAVLKPAIEWSLSRILHSIKSFTANQMLLDRDFCRGMRDFWSVDESGSPRRQVWQKDSYDHIVRSPDALARIERYIQNHTR